MKKVFALILCLSMMLGIASCAKKVEVPSKSDVKKAAKEEYDMDFKVDSEDISDDEKEAEWVLISKDGTLAVKVTWNAKKPDKFEFDDEELETIPPTTTTEETPTTTTEEPPTTTTTETTEASSPDSSDNGGVAPDPSGVKYVNFDEMNFYINGKKYTLGKTTFQDLIDDGVPFEDGELDNANNNLKSKYQSSYIKVKTGVTGITCWLEVFNDTDSGKPMSQCYVNYIYYFTSGSRDKSKASIVTFDFPLTLTPDELKANSGEPTEKIYHNEDNPKYIHDHLEWTKSGTKYRNKNRFKFEFMNNELTGITMEYIP